MFFLPLYHNLVDRRVLVVGAGITALRKIRWLVKAEAKLDVLSVNFHPEIIALEAEGELSLIKESYMDRFISNRYVLVVCATNDEEVSSKAYKVAEKAGILINCVDQPQYCSVIFPSIIDRLPILVAISSMGSSPTLARVVRGWIEELLPLKLGLAADRIGRFREHVKTRLQSVDERMRFWEKAFRPQMLEKLMSLSFEKARGQLAEELEQHISAGSGLGSIALVGAGPGDPDLITLKGMRLLQTADVVLYDKLVNPDLLEYVRRDAEIIFVGKEGPKPDDSPERLRRVSQQGKINELIVELAEKGKQVVRLKGGDPFIYGRGGEEMVAAAEKGIELQVVPGITAALGAASYAGIPLTYRNMSVSVRFVTGHRVDESKEDEYFQELAMPNQTLVIYMGLVGLADLLKNLVKAGRTPNTPAVVIENATLPGQVEVYGTIETLAAQAMEGKIKGPTTIIVGEVVAFGNAKYS